MQSCLLYTSGWRFYNKDQVKIDTFCGVFGVSRSAAAIRLEQLGYLNRKKDYEYRDPSVSYTHLIMTDSHSGILSEEAQRLGIKVLPMPFYIGEKVYMKYAKWIFVVLLISSLTSFVEKDKPTGGLNVGDMAPDFKIQTMSAERCV